MDFMTRMKEVIETGMEGSRDFLEKAREKMNEFGETSVLRLEIRQLEGQAKQLLTKLGSQTYELLIVEGKASVTAKTAEMKDLFADLDKVKKSIAEKEGLLQNQS